MKTLPLADPGRPDLRSPGRYLLWTAGGQLPVILGATVFGIAWTVAQALVPYVLGRAVDAGVVHRDGDALLRWGAVLLALGVGQAITGVFRHRYAVTNWLTSSYRVVQLVSRHATRLGHTLPSRVATGEVVSIGTNDIAYVGQSMEITGRLAGAIVSFVVVAILLLRTSVPLGLLVLIGVPVLVLALGPLLKPLHRRQLDQRERTGVLNTLAGDIVAGLRVVRGVGGEETFAARYGAQSQEVRRAGVRVASAQSLLDGVQILLPGLFVVVVTWLGARFALAGEITAGDLVAFYGFAAFLVIPISTAAETVKKWTRGLVAARRILTVLRMESELTEPAYPVSPPAGRPLVDATTGVRVEPGLLTAVVTDRQADGPALADRLGRYAEADVRWGDTPLADVALDEVRRRIVVDHQESRLFRGVLRDELDPTGERPERIAAALDAASAGDVLEALPDGLDTVVEERGRSFSGGQRQRLVLARALVADPEVLVLVEPTSAVDAHTEARIADRLGGARTGRTTVVVTSSPLVLDRADRVVLVADGRVAAAGRHADLVRESDAYRRVVTRDDEDETEPTGKGQG